MSTPKKLKTKTTSAKIGRHTVLVNNKDNMSYIFYTARKSAKRSKRLIIMSDKTHIALNGKQINILRELFKKENDISCR